jgi:hypothetical protein
MDLINLYCQHLLCFSNLIIISEPARAELRSEPALGAGPIGSARSDSLRLVEPETDRQGRPHPYLLMKNKRFFFTVNLINKIKTNLNSNIGKIFQSKVCCVSWTQTFIEVVSVVSDFGNVYWSIKRKFISINR